MPVTFPAIRPTDRRLVPGTVPQSVTRAINGRTVRRPMASHQGGMRLEVTFENVRDDQAEAIRQVRNAAKADPVLLPDELFAGDPELLVFVKFLPPDTAWRFSGDVEVEWAKRGRATVRAAFVNYRRTVFTLPPPPEIEVPPLPPLTYGFAVSETTTVNANMAIGANNWYYQAALTTAAGSIYFAGLATTAGQTYSQARWYLMKYDKDLNLLWANWLEGPYPAGTLPSNSEDNGPALAEGPGDGVFLVTKGKDYASPASKGASFRIYLFNATGALLNTAAWQIVDYNAMQNDIPAAALYVPTEDRLYIAGQSHLRVTMRGLTLDQPYVVDGGGTSQSGPKRVFWLPDKQRVLYAGRADDSITTGWYVAEYSPDLQTRYQSYSYNLSEQFGGVAVDAFGAVYFALINIYNRRTQITKLAASDGGYVPIWSKTFTVTPGSTSFVQATGCSIEVLPDGRILFAATGTEDNSSRAMRAYFYTITPDGVKAIARTNLNWTGVAAATNYSDFVDYVREVATFIAGPFTIGKTSLKLPAVGADLPLGSTAAGTNANKNMTGVTDYTELLLTDTALPSRTVISTPTRNGNPMVKWAEPAWTTSDLTATVSHVTRSTGPLTVPDQLPVPAVKPPAIDLRFEGANNSTTFVDSSTFNRALTLTGAQSNLGPYISTTQFSPNNGSTSSLRCNGGGSAKQGRISCGVSDDYTVGLGDFDCIFDVWIDGSWGVFSIPALTNGVTLELYQDNSGRFGNANLAANFQIVVPLGAWYRCRFARFQQQLRLRTNNEEVRAGSAHNFNGNNLIVGWGAAYPFTGYIDNFRFVANGLLEPWPT